MFLAFGNSVMNICVQVFVWTHVFSSLGCMPKSGMLGFKVTAFNFLSNCQIVFQSSRAALHSH